MQTLQFAHQIEDDFDAGEIIAADRAFLSGCAAPHAGHS